MQGVEGFLWNYLQGHMLRRYVARIRHGAILPGYRSITNIKAVGRVLTENSVR